MRILWALSVLLLATSARAATFTVTTTADGGAGSLRQAILDANANPGDDAIAFDIAPPGVHTIQPSSALPAIVDVVILDGTTQPGFAGTPVVEIDGSAIGGPADGLVLENHFGSTIRGLVVNRFEEVGSGAAGRGIRMVGGGKHLIVGNFVGTDPTGTVDLGNGRFGVDCTECTDCQIGGVTAADRNLLSGNDDAGVLIEGGSDVVVEGNYIGTDVTGATALAGNTGVFILTGSGTQTLNNRIGGTAPGAGNVIVANGTGINLGNTNTTGTRLEGNLIGTNAAGTVAIGNLVTGVLLNSAPGNFVGGAASGAGNVIAGASESGVRITNAVSDGNVVQGNRIGTDVTGTLSMPNGVGIIVRASASGSPVGATIGGPGGANLITHNDGAGIVVLTGFSSNLGVETSPSGVTIGENVIVDNGGLGIDLENDGITPNDDDDLDEGANGLVNAPVLDSASTGGGMTTVKASLDGAPGEAFMVELYANVTADPSGSGEGETFLTSVGAMTDGNGLADVEVMIPGELPPGTAVTATATDSAGNTSEFAINVVVGGGATTTTLATSTTTSTVSTTSTVASTITTTSMTTTTSTVTSTSTTTTTVSPTTSTVTSTSTTSTVPSTTTTATTLPSTSTSTSNTTTTSVTTTSVINTTVTSLTTTSTTGTSSTTVVPTTSSTTTTAPPPATLLTGKKLLLTDDATRPRKRKLGVVSTDGAGLALGDEADVLALVASGGNLRVVATGGDGFDASYALAASSWRPLKKKAPEKGVRYKNPDGPIRSVVIKSGRRLIVKGKGGALGQSLATEPSVVGVELELGGRRFCLAFGGSGPFKPGRKLLRRKAPGAPGCPTPGSPSGAFVD